LTGSRRCGNQLPTLLAFVVEVALFAALFVVLGLATYDVISQRTLVVILAAALLAAMLAGRLAENTLARR
jgi:K+-sensing histidine kinase KdpD